MWVVEDHLQRIINVLENAIVPILLIELVWLWRRRNLTWARIKEMFANASSLLIVLPMGALGLALWFWFFE